MDEKKNFNVDLMAISITALNTDFVMIFLKEASTMPSVWHGPSNGNLTQSNHKWMKKPSKLILWRLAPWRSARFSSRCPRRVMAKRCCKIGCFCSPFGIGLWQRKRSRDCGLRVTPLTSRAFRRRTRTFCPNECLIYYIMTSFVCDARWHHLR